MDAFIDDHKHEHGVEPICSTLAEAGYQIAPSSYYARKSRKPSPRSQSDAVWDERITTVHADNRGVYGVRKTWKAVLRAHPDEHVARCTIERRMKALGLHGVSNRRNPTTTKRPSKPTDFPADKLNRDFTAEAPNRRWVADITYVSTWSGFVYVAFVTDLYSRRIVGWRVSNSLRTDLALDALEQAIWSRRQQGIDGLVHHSDHGVQGGFNWSSQHLDLEGVDDGQGSLVDEDQRSSGRVEASVAGGQGVEALDVLSGQAAAVSGCPAGVLAGDRHWCHNSGSGDRGRRVGSCRVALVSSRWGHGADQSGRAEWPLPVLRRAGGDRDPARDGDWGPGHRPGPGA